MISPKVFILCFSSVNDDEDDGTVEFRASIKVLADKVGPLSRHRSELLDRCSRAETALSRAETALDEKTEQVKSLYTKHQIEKQRKKAILVFPSSPGEARSNFSRLLLPAFFADTRFRPYISLLIDHHAFRLQQKNVLRGKK